MDYEEAEAQQMVAAAPDFNPTEFNGTASVASGFQTPDIDLKKKKEGPLYTVLESIPMSSKGIVPGSHGYNVPK